MRKRHTVDLVMCGLFTALIVVGAFVRIDFVLPITLQSTFVILAGMLLGKKNGAVCAAVYMVLGLAGLPVFAQGGGLMYVLKPSFGYILGFILGAFVTGLIVQRRKKPSIGYLYCAGVSGIVCVYAIGVVYCCIIMSLYINGAEDSETLTATYLLTTLAALPIDLVLLVPATLIAKRVLHAIKKV